MGRKWVQLDKIKIWNMIILWTKFQLLRKACFYVKMSYMGHLCTKCYIYIIDMSPIYHKNQGHIPVIWIWEESENPDPSFPHLKWSSFWNVDYFDLSKWHLFRQQVSWQYLSYPVKHWCWYLNDWDQKSKLGYTMFKVS